MRKLSSPWLYAYTDHLEKRISIDVTALEAVSKQMFSWCRWLDNILSKSLDLLKTSVIKLCIQVVNKYDKSH